jgi:hypothetical protein
MCSIQFVFLGKVIFCRACTAEKPIRMMACDDEKQPLAVEAVAWMPIDVKIDVPMKGLSAKPLLRSLRRHSQRYRTAEERARCMAPVFQLDVSY